VLKWQRQAIWFVLLVGAAGCGRNHRRDAERYIPAPETARQALVTALDAWQADQPPGPIAAATPPVVLVDTHRKPNQRLQRYVVQGEVPGNGPRCFAVRLTFEDPPEEQKLRFVIFGIEPIWVYRQEDYDMITRWECAGAEETARETRPDAPR
jgi:hypothetical protein